MAYYVFDNTDMNNLNKLLFEDDNKTFAELTENHSNPVKIFWYVAKYLIKE